MEVSHKQIITILNLKKKYEKMKEDIITIIGSDKLDTEEGEKIKTTEL